MSNRPTCLVVRLNKYLLKIMPSFLVFCNLGGNCFFKWKVDCHFYLFSPLEHLAFGKFVLKWNDEHDPVVGKMMIPVSFTIPWCLVRISQGKEFSQLVKHWMMSNVWFAKILCIMLASVPAWSWNSGIKHFQMNMKINFNSLCLPN